MAHVSKQSGVTGVAVHPGKAHTVHLTKLAESQPGPDQALVRVRRVGVCGTDREIIEAKFGIPPPGSDNLVLGHEVLGVVEAVGANVASVGPGDIVTATVRRPDGCPACAAGQPDMCLWRAYVERGILRAHGFMVEAFVEDVEHLVNVPPALEPIGVLLEPLSVIEKAVRQANLIQRRLAQWEPKTALVVGAGPIGLLGTLLLRELGMDVHTLARTPAPTFASSIVEASGAQYVSTREIPLPTLAANLPNVDLILEASGVSEPAFEAMSALGNNGVLVLLGITGGDDRVPVPAAIINREIVLGNKVVVGSVNSAHEDFLTGVDRLAAFERHWPELTARLITNRLHGFDEALRINDAAHEGVKTVIELES